LKDIFVENIDATPTGTSSSKQGTTENNHKL